MIAHIQILYDELHPETYAGFKLRIGERKETINTGNPTVDYVAIGCVAYTIAGGEIPVICSSSVDHFVMDGGDLVFEDIPPELVQKGVQAAKDHLNMPGIPEA